MTVVALTSGAGSPGVTSLALALSIAAGRRTGVSPTLVEADPSGGVLGLRFDLRAEPSLATLASAVGRDQKPDLLGSHSQDLSGTRCLAGPSDPLVSQWMLRRLEGSLEKMLQESSRPTVIDLGRMSLQSDAAWLARCADVVAIVARPVAEESQSVLYSARTLRSLGCRPVLISVGQRPFHPEEVADVAGLRLAGVVHDDPDVARALSGGKFSERKFFRSTLWKSIVPVADFLFRAPLVPKEVATQRPAPTGLPVPLAGGQQHRSAATGVTPARSETGGSAR